MRYPRHARYRRYIRHQRHGQKLPTAKIIAYPAPTGAKVGGTVDARTLFDVMPPNTVVIYTTNNANATIGGDGYTVTYAAIGNVIITASGGNTSASVTISIAAA